MAEKTNLLFKRGAQSTLDTLTSSVEGAFYLTTDTNKLYIGKGENLAPELLNQSVLIVTSLPTENIAENTFYYVSGSNILCTYANNKWVQINPDTNTEFQITGASFSDGAVNEEGNLVYTLSLQSQTMNVRTGAAEENDDITVDLTIKPDVLADIVPEASSVGLESKTNGTKVDIATKGTGADSEAYLTIAGSGSVGVSTNGSTITINGVESTLSSAANSTSVVLTGASGEGTAVSFVADNESIVVSGAETDKIKIGHKNFSDPEVSTSESQNFISSITLDNGHITGYETGVVKDTNTTNASLNLSFADNEYALSLMDSDGNAVTTNLTSLVAAANSYTDSEILKINSALQYQGTADTSTATPTEPKDGWIYMASASGTIFGQSNVSKGDLLIYHDNTWEIIPSGDEADTDTTYTAIVTETENKDSLTYTLSASTGSDAGTALALLSGDGVVLSTDINNETKTAKVVINHAEYADITTPSKASGATKSFTGIIDLEIDNGHITNYTTQTFTPESYGLVYTADGIVNQSSGGTEVGDKIKIAAGNVMNMTTVTSDNEDGPKTTTLTINHSKPTSIDKTAQTQGIAGRTFTVNQVTTDDYGHVVANKPTVFTLPEDKNTEYKMVANKNENKIILQEVGGGSIGSISISKADSNTSLDLVSTVSSSNNEISYQIGLVWDTF